MRNIVLSAAPLLLFCAACESIDSANVRTDGIYASLSASSDESGDTKLAAYLKTGGSLSNTFLDLSEGDRLIAYFGAESQEMDRESLLGEVWYEASFDGNAENTPVRIEFSRMAHSEDETKCRGGSAPDSVVTLPAPFAITKPLDDARLSRKDSVLEIAWSPAGSDPMHWDLSGSCISSMGGDISGDSGQLVIEKGKLQEAPGMHAGETCNVTFSISRKRAGTVDPAYGEGGNFAAAQVRAVTFSSAP